ncbi:MAG TPA: hypothetical protein VMO47_01750, partial [Rhodothermales bacterium]|nr:hypothetical protein [Rhodothermales bacterium]
DRRRRSRIIPASSTGPSTSSKTEVARTGMPVLIVQPPGHSWSSNLRFYGVTIEYEAEDGG